MKERGKKIHKARRGVRTYRRRGGGERKGSRKERRDARRSNRGKGKGNVGLSTEKGRNIKGKLTKKKETSIRNNNTLRENMREGILILATEETDSHIANRNKILMTKTTRGRKSIVNKGKVVKEKVIRRRRRK